jgi:protein-disulfide isomerase
MKDLQADSIGIKKISKIEGDKVSFEGADFTKTIGDILMKIEGTETEEAKKAAESLAKIKNDPDKMKKVATFSEFLQDEKNKDKIAEIEKIMTDEGEGGS